ncbi:hypothetical protein [uncultured Dokdonia sp.]|uniref:hypothetical protein n=1 Tax=uncultured Dokdonia sp. TaxID=575653 RepID=UPI002627561C|nr:hypothetical protein [uncultured Dokdonia sp.]
MLKNILNQEGVQQLETSKQKSVTGGGSCASGIYCDTNEDCGGGWDSRCIRNECHLF